ncbi:hypothetical protein GQ53DRAFT_660338 [Thozetella sp. PMI_491]|nr:hypothetical protein GQ53DRAFT_660338 [Thozetella sp. PMI_491]
MLQAVPLDASAIPPSSSAYFASPSFDSAASSTTSYRRPQSAKSARSARSQSPLFARWRRHHPPMPVDARDVAHANASGNNNNYRVGKKHAKDGELTRTTSINKRPFGAPQLTREEFEALPLAIQRKYFSTLERLRFAQESNGVDGISQHYNDISAQNAKRRKARQHRSSSENLGGRLRRRSLRDAHLPSPDRYPVTELPEKIKRSHFSREDQVFLARQLRASVILDAADEAIYKIGRRASKHLAPDVELLSPIVSSRRNSMESEKRAAPEPGPDSFYDSFRWLDDEEDLDLRLFLDDYHANLREEVPSPTKERRPSFRRHLSISKIPFGRSSVSSSRPATKDAASPSPVSPSQSPVVNSSGSFNHGRRKSRALSLITPKHGAHDSLSAFDPAAAHYQDPEARLKLRVYLASPQKFDEAIEFGFPSMDALSASPVITKDSRAALHKRQSRQKLSDDPSMRTFLADDDDDDDKASLNSDQPSLADPESPKTPQYFENKPSARPMRVSSENHASKPSDGGYAQVPASSREMTLRMTLTRPDLRANEDQIYGWQAKGGQPRRKSLNVSAGLDAHAVTYIGDSQHKESIEKVFAGIDHWNANQPPDGSVMKRIWNRVRRS